MSETAKHDDSTLDHVLKYTGVFGGVQGLVILVSIVRTKLASIFLGTAGFGLMGIYSSISEFVHNSSNLGIPVASVQHLSERYEACDEEAIRHSIRVVRTWSFWSALLAASMTLLAAPLLARLFDMEGGHFCNVMLLAPMTFALSISAGEISILKGLRRLKRVASISALNAVATLCLTIPFFWSMGLRGIIISLNMSTLTVMAIHLAFTTPLYPWRISFFSRDIVREGWPLLRVGIPFVLAAIVGSGTYMLLQAFLKKESSEETIGLYRAAYMLMVTYAGIVYSAFDADFFPRLSSVNHCVELRNKTINQQIRASVLLVAPLLILMIVFMPVILSILTKEEFLPAADMAVCAVFFSFFRGITTPISYTALACGHSVRYMIMETIYDVVSLLLIATCYHYGGLMGAGFGMSLSALFDLFLIGITYGYCYHFRMTASTARLALTQTLIVAASLVVCLFVPGLWKYVAGLLLLALSAWFSYGTLSRESQFIEKIKNKFHR